MPREVSPLVRQQPGPHRPETRHKTQNTNPSQKLEGRRKRSRICGRGRVFRSTAAGQGGPGT
eukprot:3239419-Rhodomonas_salina.6